MYNDCQAKMNLEHTQLIYRDGMANQCYIALNTIIEWFIYGLPRKKFDSSLKYARKIEYKFNNSPRDWAEEDKFIRWILFVITKFSLSLSHPPFLLESFFLYSACSLLSVGDHSNIILGVLRSNHKERDKFKDNIIKQQFG